VAAPAASPASSPALSRVLAEVRAGVDARLPVLLAGDGHAPDPRDPLPSAAREALLSLGKRVRPALVVLAGDLFEASRPRLIDAGCAIEMVHAASLVLDDLPSMDDATLRRGRPALHVAHGEGNAILAAVTLLARAFGLIAEAGLHARRGGIPGSLALDLVSRLADASGLLGLASGQALDLATDEADATFDRLETIHARKTGALFVASAEFGAVLGGARQNELSAVRSYARNVGLAFQIVDDLLETSAAGETGKASRRAPAPTFVRHVGADGARTLVAELTEHALASLKLFGKRADLLREFAEMLRDRKK
jgi:geranylgeranyl pyrophosphate synthase